jgi:2-haloacid dehalogenase
LSDRWATFDCHGTLIDWEAGLREGLLSVWPDADADALLRRHHAVEPIVQQARDLPYREVLARSLEAVAAIEGRTVPPGARFRLAESLPSWMPFPEVPGALAELRRRGWRLAILSNTDPDLLAASLASIGVGVDLRVTAVDAGSYKPAHGHLERFFTVSGADPPPATCTSRQARSTISPLRPTSGCRRCGSTGSGRRARCPVRRSSAI